MSEAQPGPITSGDPPYDLTFWGGMTVTEWLHHRAPQIFTQQAAFMRVARRHALIPFLALDTPPSDRPEAAWCEALRGWWAYQVRENVRRTGALITLVHALERAGVHPLVVKGPVLAHLMNGNVASRMFVDLDVAVPVKEAMAAMEVLRAHGYLAARTFASPQLALHVRTAYHMSFIQQHTRDLVELHWHLVPAVYRSVFDERRAWARQRRISLGGHSVATLSVLDTMHFLALHGAKHRWRRLAWIYDFARLAAVETELDWTALEAEARARGSDRMLALARALATSLQRETPAEVTPKIGALVHTVWDHVWDAPAWNAPESAGHREDRAFQLATLRRWRDKAYYVAIWALSPTYKDIQVLTLPGAWTSLYYVIRPFRLLRDWLSRRRGRRP